jgi:hypothetical protein
VNAGNGNASLQSLLLLLLVVLVACFPTAEINGTLPAAIQAPPNQI